MSKYSDSIFNLASPEGLVEVMRNGSIILEVGVGNGLFLEYISRKHLEKTVIGVELDIKRAKKAKYRIDTGRISNAIVLSGDAITIIPLFFPDECVEMVFMNFPEPWSKEYQWKNRLYELGFMSMIDRIVKVGGLFHLATDVENIYNTISNVLCCVLGNWVLDENLSMNYRDKFIPTLYYEKWRSEDRNFWWGVWMKRY